MPSHMYIVSSDNMYKSVQEEQERLNRADTIIRKSIEHSHVCSSKSNKDEPTDREFKRRR